MGRTLARWVGVVVVGMVGGGVWAGDATRPLVLAPVGLATLRSGAEVEILGVTEDGAQWWDVEGFALPGDPTKGIGACVKDQKFPAVAGERVVWVAMRATGQGAEAPAVAVEMRGRVATTRVEAGRGLWCGVVSARLPANVATGRVRVWLSMGNWKKVIETTGREPAGEGAYGITGALEREGRVVLVVCEPGGVTAAERRLVVVDKAGTSHDASAATTAETDSVRMTSYEFSDVRRGDVARVFYAVRPYDQWVEFQNVALKVKSGEYMPVKVATSDAVGKK